MSNIDIWKKHGLTDFLSTECEASFDTTTLVSARKQVQQLLEGLDKSDLLFYLRFLVSACAWHDGDDYVQKLKDDIKGDVKLNRSDDDTTKAFAHHAWEQTLELFLCMGATVSVARFHRVETLDQHVAYFNKATVFAKYFELSASIRKVYIGEKKPASRNGAEVKAAVEKLKQEREPYRKALAAFTETESSSFLELMQLDNLPPMLAKLWAKGKASAPFEVKHTDHSFGSVREVVDMLEQEWEQVLGVVVGRPRL